MKFFFTCILIVCSFNASKGQSPYLVLTNDSLQKLLNKYASSTNYQKAAEVKKEKESRDFELRTIKELEKEKEIYLTKSDYSKVAEIDLKLKKLKFEADKKVKLRNSIKEALKKENYQEAAKYKEELIDLINPKDTPKSVDIEKETNQNSTTPSQSITNLIQRTSNKIQKLDSNSKIKFSAILYNYVSGLPIGFKYMSENNTIYTIGFGSNDYADFILRTDIGNRTNFGLYYEIGALTYTIDSKYDKSDNDIHFAYDWELGYADKYGSLAFSCGLHFVQFNSMQFSLGIGF